MIPIVLVLIGAIVLLVAGVPVAFAFVLGGFLLSVIYGMDMPSLINSGVLWVSQYSILALPLFIMLGTLMSRGELAKRIVDLLYAVVGHIKGSMGIVLILTNTFFGAMCGVATSALAAIGTVMIPEMEKLGYPRSYSTALAIPSSVLSILIPPSTSLIIFGIASRLSIPLLFASTFIPGIILTVFLCIFNMVMTRHMSGIQVAPKTSFARHCRKIAHAGRKSFFILLAPFIILGGIYSGIFTPTEAACVAVIYALIVGLFIYRSLNIRKTGQAVLEAGRLTGCMMVIFFSFLILARILILKEVPASLTAFFFSLSSNYYIIIFLFNIVLFIMGMFMSEGVNLILAAILFLPVGEAIGMDPYHFAAMCTVNLAMGNITPPVAPLLYLGGIVGGGLSLKDYVKPVIYCLVLGYLPVVILTSYVPALSLTLPHLITTMMK